MSDRIRKRLRTMIVVLASAALVLPAAAWAGHQFTDVPNSNIFHDDIDWMRDNGVTAGCNPPANDEYCPDDPVTREQMAAFMHRLDSKNVFLPADGKATDSDLLDGMDSTAFLGATDQAVDSDLLDGLESGAFARSENFQPYFVTIDGATDATLATFGPLTLIGRCDPGVEVLVLVTSSVDGWFETESETTVFSAGDEAEVMDGTTTTGVEEDIDQGSAISENADGDTLYYMGYDGESTLLGLDIFGHDCVIAGTAQTNTTPK